MWQAIRESLADGRIYKLTLRHETTPMQYIDVVDGWLSNAAFRHFFNQLLAEAPWQAFFWEMPPVTRATQDQLFECVLVDSPALSGVHPDASAFADYFKDAEADTEVAGFTNLGCDAFLVAPRPLGDADLYPHLAAFVRGAPATRQQAFWQYLGAAVRERLSDQPLWLSTSGLGVYWLHARLDSFPKYYTYGPYMKFPLSGL